MSLSSDFSPPARHPDARIGPRGNTALHLAVLNGDIAAAKKAFDNGASTGVFDTHGHTPLSHAAGKGDADMVRFILAHGGEKEIDHAGSSGTALGMAAHGGYFEVMQILLSAGAAIDGPDDEGTTPLMQTIFAGRTDAAQFLLMRGANANAVRNGGETALHLAAREGDEELLRALFIHGAAQTIDNQTVMFLQTPLHIAVQSQEETATRVLLEMGARTDLTNGKDNTPLGTAIEAVGGGMTGLIRLMIENGHTSTRDVSATQGMRPLQQAVSQGKIAAVRELIRLGADPEQGDAEGNNALHIAGREGWMGIAAFLVSTGMNPEIKNNAGQTPLYVARLKDNDDMAVLLIRAENDYVMRNKKPKSQRLAPK